MVYFILSRTATFLDAWANQRNQAGTEAASVLSSGVGADHAVSGFSLIPVQDLFRPRFPCILAAQH